MEFSGYISDQRSPFYAALLAPIAVIKGALDYIRKSIHNLIWSELTQGNSPEEPDLLQDLINLMAFILFCVFCLLSSKFRQYYPAITLFLGCCWYLDLLLSKRIYAKKLPVHLTLTKDNYYQLESLKSHKFHHSKLVAISIHKVKIFSHAFNVAIAQPWQIILVLENGKHIPIHEEHQAIKALNTAKDLAQSLEVPFNFLNAQTQIDQKIRHNWQIDHKLNRSAIALNQTPHKWHIFTHWALRDSWYAVGKVLIESGFLLFVLILSEFMARFGRIIDNIITIQRTQGIIYINFSDLFTGFGFNWLQVIPIAIAIALTFWRGIQISNIKHLYLTADHLTYGINHKAIAQLELLSLQLNLINQPEPMLLLFDDKVAIEIKDLLKPDNYLELFLTIDEGLQYFQAHLSNQKVSNQKV